MSSTAVYGFPIPELASVPDDARQCSPLVPEAAALEDCPDASQDEVIIAAPPGSQERRYVLAQALRCLKPGGRLVAMAPNKLGGQRLKSELEALNCQPAITSKSHHRIAVCKRPAEIDDLKQSIEDNGARLDEDLGLWTWPGVFSWNRPDPGSLRLIDALPDLAGRGADLGTGLGLLAHRVLQSDTVTELTLIDLDRRAVEMAWRNVGDDRIKVKWADVRKLGDTLTGLDFIVMNPPFHETGVEDKGLGRAFIKQAARMLRPGGVMWMVANRHLPYEDVLSQSFKSSKSAVEDGGYKIIEAHR